MSVQNPHPMNPFIFPDADLEIVVFHDGKRVIGKVVSAVMCSASPVWKKFIKPPFGTLGPARTDLLSAQEQLELRISKTSTDKDDIEASDEASISDSTVDSDTCTDEDDIESSDEASISDSTIDSDTCTDEDDIEASDEAAISHSTITRDIITDEVDIQASDEAAITGSTITRDTSTAVEVDIQASDEAAISDSTIDSDTCTDEDDIQASDEAAISHSTITRDTSTVEVDIQASDEAAITGSTITSDAFQHSREDTKTPQLDFQSDEAYTDALLILLKIAHHQFCEVPKTISLDTLYHLAIVTDEYNCVELTQPWIARWLRNTMNSHYDDPKMLFIAWNFGLPDRFEDVAQHLLYRICDGGLSKLPACGENSDKNGMQQSIQQSIMVEFPPLILDRLYELRRQKLSEILKTLYEAAKDMLPQSETDYSHCDYNDKHCASITYGSLMLGLVMQDLLPERNADQMRDVSLNAMGEKAKALDILTLPGNSPDNTDHSQCKPDLKSWVEEDLAYWVQCTLPAHANHMKAQKDRLTPVWERDDV